jgi:hypothetical protein
MFLFKKWFCRESTQFNKVDEINHTGATKDLWKPYI